MKRSIRMVMALLISTCFLGGCTDENGAVAVMEQWEKEALLEAEEPPEKLYQAAQSEDILQIYTVSARLFDVAESFQKQYPGLLAEVTYLRAEEMEEKLFQNAENRTYGCDIIFITNGDGSLTESLIPDGLAYQYIPYDMKDCMRKGGSAEYLSVLLEVPLLAYNVDYYQSPPITNWWELTEPQWKGKFYITDPTRSMISYTLFAMLMQHTEKMEEAYEEYFGEEFAAEESAGKTFLRSLIENDLQVVNDSDDVANAIGAPGRKSPAVGLMNASKLRLCEQGYPLQVCYEIKPFAGVINPANIMIAGGAKNINSAKLFIRWILGEADGTGKGYMPFLQEGAWPARADVEGDASRKLEEMEIVYTDEAYTGKQREEFLDFWNKCFP